MGKRHLRLARSFFPNSDIRVLTHRSKNQSLEHSNGFFSNINDAIKFNPQIAVIANPATFHISTALILAKIGTHLLIEKPLSTSQNNVQNLINLCQQKKIVLLIGYNMRFLKSLQYFNKVISEGIIGNILSVRCEAGQYLPSWRPDSDYRNTVSARLDLGGGVLLELSHEIDYLRWIFGDIKWVNATLSCQSELEVNVEDTAHLTFGFSPEINGKQLIGSVNLDFIRHDSRRICEAIGDKGSLRWDGMTGQVSIYEPESQDWRELFCCNNKPDDSYVEEWKDFLASIKDEKKPFINGKDGLIVIKIIEAIRESSKLNMRVIVDNIDKFDEVNP